MAQPDDCAPSTRMPPASQHLAGPPFLRYYREYNVVAWQPHGTLDDLVLDQIAEWIVTIEKVSPPFKRFIDLTQLTAVAVRTRHIFEFARKRAQQFTAAEPVHTAIFCDEWVGYGIACLYEALMQNTLIHARAFHDLVSAAQWLDAPVDVLMLKDKPTPADGGSH